MGANETDKLEIMAREDAIRTNEHGKKRVRKAKEAGEVVKLEEGADFEGSENPQPADSAGAPGNSDQENNKIMAREDAIRTNEHGKKRVRKAESSNSKAGAAVKLEEGADFEGSENPQPVDGAGAPGNSDQENNNNSQPEVPSKPSNNSDQENNNNPQPTDSVGSPNNSDQENNNKKSAFTPLSEDAKDRSDTKKHVTRQSKGKTNAAKEPSFFTSKREETVILKGDSSKKGKNAEDSKPSKNNGSSDSNTRKSERTRKTNPKYSSD